MATITSERLKQLVRYDPETGIFYWLVQRGPRHPGDVAGTITSQGYKQLALDRHSFRCNRMAFLYMNGRLPESQIDHINGDRLDDRWINLREATRSMNQQNMRNAHSTSKSGILGVFFLKRKQKWTARLRRKGKDHYIGFFETMEDASAAYVEKKRLIHEGCTI